MTQEKLAEQASLSVRTLRKLESGASQAPHRDTIDLLSTALGLTPEDRTLLESAARQQRPLSPTAYIPTARLSGMEDPSPLDPTLVPLVGRAPELTWLEGQLRGSGPPLLLLAGEPGIGKSRLLRETILRAHGLTILEGGCHRRSGQEPYAPVVAALESYVRRQSSAHVHRMLEGCAWMVRLLPELADMTLVPAPSWTLPPAQERRMMFASVWRFLANIAGPSGTLLVLDDLHWAGQDALDLLAALLRMSNEPAGSKLHMVAAYRSTEVRAADPLGILLADLARERLATAFELGPLAPKEVNELLRALLADLPPYDRDQLQQRLATRTGGVPYYVVSWAQAVHNYVYEQEEAAGRKQSEGAEADEGGLVPWNVSQSIRQRLALLPEKTRDLVNAMAISGHNMAVPELIVVASRIGQDEAETLEALDRAEEAGLILEQGNGYQFSHDLIREVAVADLGAVRTVTLHRWVAEAILVAAPRDRERRAAELAWHFARGGMPSQALPFALLAGEQAKVAYAHIEAERHIKMALDLARAIGDPESEAVALERLADILWESGRAQEMLAALDTAAQIRRALGQLDQYALDIAHLNGPYGLLGQPQESLGTLRTLLKFLATLAAVSSDNGPDGPDEPQLRPNAIPRGTGPAEPTDVSAPADTLTGLAALAAPILSAGTAAHVYYALAACLLSQGLYGQAIPFGEYAVRYSQAAGDFQLQVRTLEWLAIALMSNGEPANALTTFANAYLVAQEAKDLQGLCDVQVNRGYLLVQRGAFAEGTGYAADGLEAAERHGSPNQVAQGLCGLGLMALYTGNWDQALDYCQRAANIVPQLGVDAIPAWIALIRGKICLTRGDMQPAREYLAEALQKSEHPDSVAVRVEVQLTLAEADLVHSNAEAALSRLESIVARTNPYQQATTDLMPLVAWACLALGEVERATTVLAQFLEQVREQQYVVLLAQALRVQALLALRQDRWQDAGAALDEAISLAHAMPYPYAVAKARYIYGDLHAARGEQEGAREQYEAALAILGQLGERLYAEQVERALAEVTRP